MWRTSSPRAGGGVSRQAGKALAAALAARLQRVASQKRILTNERTKKKKTSGELGADLFLGLPARAYDPEALKEYKKARRKKFKGKRTSDSEGSDEELEEIKKKKKK